MEYREFAERIVSVFLPQRCLSCGDVVAYDDFWCGRCAENGKAALVKYGKVTCAFPHSFADALAATTYDGGARELIWRLKKKPDKRVLLFFARELCGLMSAHWGDVAFDAAVPVPSGKARLKERGFNPAEVLALQIGRRIGIPVYGDALVRHGTQAQRGLTAAQRQENAANAYTAGKTKPLCGKTVLLTDDVFTTGATAEACARILLASGAERVYVATAAFTRPDRHS